MSERGGEGIERTEVKQGVEPGRGGEWKTFWSGGTDVLIDGARRQWVVVDKSVDKGSAEGRYHIRPAC